jgi:hypothetical protein
MVYGPRLVFEAGRYRKAPLSIFDVMQRTIVLTVTAVLCVAGALAPFVIGAYIALRLMKMGC